MKKSVSPKRPKSQEEATSSSRMSSGFSTAPLPSVRGSRAEKESKQTKTSGKRALNSPPSQKIRMSSTMKDQRNTKTNKVEKEFESLAEDSYAEFSRRVSLDSVSVLTATSGEDLYGFNSGPEFTINNLSTTKDTYVERSLREAHAIAQLKANEFAGFDRSKVVQSMGNLPAVMHATSAHRVYTAISTLLYATLSMTKVASLEKFIRKQAAVLPRGVYDAMEWGDILDVAKKFRLSMGYELHKLVHRSSVKNDYDNSNNTLPSISDNKNSGNNSSDAPDPEMSLKLKEMTAQLHSVMESREHLELAMQTLRVEKEAEVVQLMACLKKAESESGREQDAKAQVNDLKNAPASAAAHTASKSKAAASSSVMAAENSKLRGDVEKLKREMKELEEANFKDKAGSTALLEQSMRELTDKLAIRASEKDEESKKCAALERRILELESTAAASSSTLEQQVTADKDKAEIISLKEEVSRLQERCAASEEKEEQSRAALAQETVRGQRERGETERKLGLAQQELALCASTTQALQKAAAAAAAAAEEEAAAAPGGQSIESLQAAAKQAALKLSSVEAALMAEAAKSATIAGQLSEANGALAAATQQLGARETELAEARDMIKKRVSELQGQASLVGGLNASVSELTAALESSKEESVSLAEALRAVEGTAAAAAKSHTQTLMALQAKLEEETRLHTASKAAGSELEQRADDAKRAHDAAMMHLQEELSRKQAEAEHMASVAAAAAASGSADPDLKEEQQPPVAVKKEMQALLKQKQAKWNEEKRELEKAVADMKAAAAAAAATERERESPSAPALAQDGSSREVVNALQTEVALLKRQLEESTAAAARAINKGGDVAEWEEKLAIAQKQANDLRARLAKASETAAAATQSGAHSAAVSAAAHRYVGSAKIRAPSEAHRLHQGKAKKGANGGNKMGPAVAAGKIQASMRGMLTRSKLLQAAHTTAAANSGLMTAVNGTTQGQGGWYTKLSGEGGERVYFYFCLDRGEFVALCGPLGEEKFRACIRSDAKRTRKDMYIPVHRSGVEGIRLQSEHLSRQHISSTRELEESTVAHRREVNRLRNEARSASDKDQRVVASYKQKCRELEGDLLKSRRESDSLHQRVNKNSHSQGSHDEANFQRGAAHFKRLVLVQSVVRSFLARKKAKRVAVAMAANKKGVMQALGKTKQGKTGWYLNPGGEVYYYTNVRGEWNRVCGPVSENQYYLAVQEARTAVKSGLGRDMGLLRTRFDVPGKFLDAFGSDSRFYLGHKSQALFLVSDVAAVGKKRGSKHAPFIKTPDPASRPEHYRSVSFGDSDG